ncbi:hypothetical protein PAXRUDRAFT_132532 [Paxillus rubicundulus Ve08.2h10]|uniref:Uncharacterized protein n=1 Tax=Paxillus rubicundulus Ve08.2h10 TaxID=930991 RepID=A0A0D0E987_9AGAM|nr:hypothetical protein PAXRUDRAFT_132532 [Paxillus rubicundulus Ve08.2h10]
MARKTQNAKGPSSDDDAPEVVSQSTSKANLKRDQKALRDFEAEQKARKKAQNRERDQKLKDRARVTKAARRDATLIGKSFFDEDPHAGCEGEDGDESGDDDEGRALEARMLKAMMDAAEERDSGEEDEDEEDEFAGFGGMDMDDDTRSDSGSASEEDHSDNVADEMWQGVSNLDSGVDPEAPTDDEEMDGDSEDNESTPPQKNIRSSNRRMDYLADDLFLAAFSQKSKSSTDKKTTESSKLRTLKKRRRKTNARAKDLVIGGRTIRTLPRASDPRSQATALTIPPSHARKFIDQSLAVKGKQALLKAKRRGWERRPANIGVMKSEGAPFGFARSRQ